MSTQVFYMSPFRKSLHTCKMPKSRFPSVSPPCVSCGVLFFHHQGASVINVQGHSAPLSRLGFTIMSFNKPCRCLTRDNYHYKDNSALKKKTKKTIEILILVVVHCSLRRNKGPACVAGVGRGLNLVTWQDVEDRANLVLLPQLLSLPLQPSTTGHWRESLNRSSRDFSSSHPVALVWTDRLHQWFRVVSMAPRPPALKCSIICSQWSRCIAQSN